MLDSNWAVGWGSSVYAARWGLGGGLGRLNEFK